MRALDAHSSPAARCFPAPYVAARWRHNGEAATKAMLAATAATDGNLKEERAAVVSVSRAGGRVARAEHVALFPRPPLAIPPSPTFVARLEPPTTSHIVNAHECRVFWLIIGGAAQCDVTSGSRFTLHGSDDSSSQPNRNQRVIVYMTRRRICLYTQNKSCSQYLLYNVELVTYIELL